MATWGKKSELVFQTKAKDFLEQIRSLDIAPGTQVKVTINILSGPCKKNNLIDSLLNKPIKIKKGEPLTKAEIHKR